MRNLAKLGTVLVLAIVCATIVRASEKSEYADISFGDLKAAIAAHRVTIIDCNGTTSYHQSGHMPGAIDFEARHESLAQLLPANKNALVVAYCKNTH